MWLPSAAVRVLCAADCIKIFINRTNILIHPACPITAQIEGNEVVYSILLNKTETELSREGVEGRFERELSRK